MTAPSTASIIEPCWTKPAWISPGHELVAVLASSSAPQTRCWLRNDTTRIDLVVAESAQTSTGCQKIRCLVPDGTPPGLYGFEIGMEEGLLRTSNAVSVVAPELDRFCFAHITDLHFGQHLVDPGELSYLGACRRLIALLNERQPLFVAITGDVVSRYGDDKRALNSDQITAAARQAHATLSELRVPLVLTAGNHDVAFPASRSAWETYMGRPQRGGSDDFSFNIGPAHIAVLEAFVHFDPGTGRVSKRSFTETQLDWLRRDIQAARSELTFLCTHFDYTNQLLPEIDALGIDMVLYGHSKQPKATPDMPAAAARNGHLRENQCRFVSVDGERFACELIDWWQAVGYTS